MSTPRRPRVRSQSSVRRDGSIPLGRVGGIPITVSSSFLILALFITFAYGATADTWSADLDGGRGYLLAAVFAVLLGVSILLHELGHALVGRSLGLQVTSIQIYLLGGVSQVESPRRPRESFAVSIIGPLVSAVLAVAAWYAHRHLEPNTPAWVLAVWLAWSNGSVAILNMLPGLPLDGGWVLAAGVWAATGDRVRSIIVGGWVGRVVAVAIAIFVIARAATGQDVGDSLYLPIGLLVAWYLWSNASSSLGWAQSRQSWSRLDARRLVAPVAMAHRQTTVAEAVQTARRVGARAICVLDDDLRIVGVVQDATIGQLPSAQWGVYVVGQLASTPPALAAADVADGERLRDAIARAPAPGYLVLHPDGSPGGFLVTQDVIDALAHARGAAA